MTSRGTAHLTLGALLVAVVLLAFTAGWWIGRTTRLDLATEVRLARIEERLAEVSDAARAAPRAEASPTPPTAAAPAPPPGGAVPGQVYAIEVGDSPAKGPPDAPVTIVAFSDFECPYCASAHPTVERILAEYRGKVRFVFKHNPLPFHRNALLAHRAAVAAHRQGKFWEMYDLLFASQDRLDRENLLAYAQALGLDLKSFEEALASPESTQVVSADMSQAGRVGIEGVPAFFVNGRFVAGAQPYPVFQELIEKELHPKG